MTDFLRIHSKAISGGLVALLTAYLGVRSGGVTGNELLAVVGATLAGAGITWGAPFNLGPGAVYGAPPARPGARRADVGG